MKGLIKDVVIALVIVLVVTAVIKPTIVKEHSMDPTLHENNYLLINKLAYKFGEVERGDIIVFESDLESEKGDHKLLIKRVIGLPGETITIQGGEVYINGVMQQEDYLNDGTTSGEIIDYVVPEGEYFVMGDNRLVSIDSRSEEVGCVPEDAIMGKAFVRLYPFNKIGGLY